MTINGAQINMSALLQAPFTRCPEPTPQEKLGYRTAKPFPHCAIDGLFPDDLLEEVVNEFPEPGTPIWNRLADNEYSMGKSVSDPTRTGQDVGPHTLGLFGLLTAPSFIGFLEDLTGIKGLVPDPYFYAAGLHQIETGGHLQIHSDFHFHPYLKLYRRVNVLLYLNRDWPDAYGGALELLDGKLQHRVQYPPTWNRTVIHNVTADALHGFPDPIRCPNGMTRKSVAAWYYTSELPAREQVDYDMYEPSFVTPDRGPAVKARIASVMRGIVPPAVFAALRYGAPRNTRPMTGADIGRFFARCMPPALVKGILTVSRRER